MTSVCPRFQYIWVARGAGSGSADDDNTAMTTQEEAKLMLEDNEDYRAFQVGTGGLIGRAHLASGPRIRTFNFLECVCYSVRHSGTL